MTTVAGEPAAPAAGEQRHRLTAPGGVAAGSTGALSPAAYGPGRLRLRLAGWEPGHDG